MKRACVLGVVLLAGCTAGTAYRAPELPIASAWRAAGGTMPAPTEWWRGFGDAALDALETRAGAANLDIAQALARVDQARGAARGAAAARYPGGDVGGYAARVTQTLDAGTGQLSRYVPSFPRSFGEEQIGGRLSWDLDFAGGIRRQQEAARAQLAGAEAGVAAARLAVSAELADSYLQWRGLTAEGAAARARVTALTRRQAIMAVRVRTGAAPREALDPGIVALAQAEAAAAALDAASEGQRARIAVLIGQSPSLAIAALAAPVTVTEAPDPALGLPADVLRRRPDVAAAEARLIAAHAGVGAALAEYYPKLSLSGMLGLDSTHLASLVSGDALAAQAVLGLRWRLFDFARIDAEVRAAHGREGEALAAYRAAVLRAAGDVETSFAALAAAHVRAAMMLRAGHAAADAAAIAARAYAAGGISRDALLAATETAAAADGQAAAARADEASAIVACYRALGS